MSCPGLLPLASGFELSDGRRQRGIENRVLLHAGSLLRTAQQRHHRARRERRGEGSEWSEDADGVVRRARMNVGSWDRSEGGVRGR